MTMSKGLLKNLSGNARASKKKSKYKNKKLKVNGSWYDSKAEYKREQYLIRQQNAGIICDLVRQVVFSIDVNKIHVCKYIADWSYFVPSMGVSVIEDFKGLETDTFRLKKKLMKACHGIDIWINKEKNAHCIDKNPHLKQS